MGLIKEEEEKSNSVGRRRKMLKFAKENGYTIGIDLGATSLNAVTEMVCDNDN